MPGLDGRKMSKSYNNALNIADDMDTVWNKLRTMTTDPARERRTDPGTPEKCPVWDVHKFFNKNQNELLELDKGCRNATIGCVDCKKKLMAHVKETMDPILARRAKFENKDDDLKQILEAGALRAKKVAEATMDEVFTAMAIRRDNSKKEDDLSVLTTELESENFEVQLGSFSGPLDLLCHLVEGREMDPAKLNITELVSQYVNFLLNSKRTSLNELAEFFSFVSRLLLKKVRSLFPASLQEDVALEDFDEGYIETEDDLRRLLEEFIPYRKATSLLKTYQEERERSFNRVFDEDSSPFYDLGDLYGLASRWWQLLEEYHQRLKDTDLTQDDLWEDIPDAIPEER